MICLLLITHASQKAVKLDKENRDDINKEGEREGERGREREREREKREEKRERKKETIFYLVILLGVHELTCYHAILFPVVGSLMLLIFFYFFEFIQYIYTVLTAGTYVHVT